ncbi:hypothetical protein AVEN_35950-1 [Araneus ventricosus]|uniref:Uncharacterized protein n=1 Tax=Araneus ventricosus TaxID=182803 RepID=A0A4Y2GZQ3_ARAVE|nr:hypothetical protein AVEN_35950-1 [Araneus ventricosus]
MSRFEATRGLFWNGPRNFEPRSDYEYDTRAAPPPNFRNTPAEGRLTLYVRFNVQQAQYRTDLRWNRVSNPKAETLPLDHLGPIIIDNCLIQII